MTENPCPRQHTRKVAVCCYRKLVQILTAHDLQRRLERSVRPHRADFFSRPHDVENRGIRPARSVQVFYFVRCNQACQRAAIDHQKTAVSGSENLLLHQILDILVAIYDRTVMSHNILGCNACQYARQPGFDITLASRLQQKPADESDPQPPKARSSEELIPTAMKSAPTIWPVRAAALVERSAS